MIDLLDGDKSDRGGRDQREGSLFDRHVGVDVGLGRADVCVAEPEGDHGAVDAGVQQRHRAAVSEHVRVDLLVV